MLALVENAKTCTKCGEAKPATVEYFKRRTKSRDGLHTQCRACDHLYYIAHRDYNLGKRKEYYLAHRREHPAKALAREGFKKCTKCQQVFPATVDHFRLHGMGRDGLHPWCRTCDLADSRRIDNENRAQISARKKATRKNNPISTRARDGYHRRKNPKRLVEARLKHFYGLSINDVNRMNAEQGGACAICNKPPRGKAGCAKLHIDHDHATGKVRALLCTACNKGLGIFRDDINILQQAIGYLRKHNEPSFSLRSIG